MFRWLLFCLLFFVTFLPVRAQTGEWEVVLYDNTRLLVVGPEGGAESIELPEEAQNLEVVARNFIALSPDGQYLAFAKTDTTPDGSFTTNLKLANLASGECCIEPASLFVQDYTYLLVGPFSPDSTRLFVSAVRWLPEDERYENYVLGLDIATGEVAYDSTNGVSYLSDPGSLWRDQENNTTLLPEWTINRLILFPACIPCEGVFEGRAWRWNLETGEAKEFDRFYSSLGDRLALTGEYIYAAENPDYPPTSGDFPIRTNVITYLSKGGASQEQVVVYQLGEGEAFVPKPNWVLDGMAYLLHVPSQTTATLVNRDGVAETLTFDDRRNFVAGTPDGWLMVSAEDGKHDLFHYTRTADGEIEATMIGTANVGFPQLLQQPVLGTAISDTLTPALPA